MAFPFEEYAAEVKKQGHSVEFLEATINYAKNLDQKNLPVIFSRQHFASLVGMPSHLISRIIQFRDNQYYQFQIQKRNGKGFRLIRTPEKKLLYLQRWINKNILQRVTSFGLLYRFCSGKIFSNQWLYTSEFDDDLKNRFTQIF